MKSRKPLRFGWIVGVLVAVGGGIAWNWRSTTAPEHAPSAPQEIASRNVELRAQLEARQHATAAAGANPHSQREMSAFDAGAGICSGNQGRGKAFGTGPASGARQGR